MYIVIMLSYAQYIVHPPHFSLSHLQVIVFQFSANREVFPAMLAQKLFPMVTHYMTFIWCKKIAKKMEMTCSSGMFIL